MNSKVKDSIVNVMVNDNHIIFEVEEPFYLMELIENYNKDYIYEHSTKLLDKIYVNVNELQGKFLSELGDIGYVRVCSLCGCEVIVDDDLVSNDYDYACLNCDMDLWCHETKLVKTNDCLMRVTEEDKNEYRENMNLIE